jgi:hypothetical protein
MAEKFGLEVHLQPRKIEAQVNNMGSSVISRIGFRLIIGGE